MDAGHSYWGRYHPQTHKASPIALSSKDRDIKPMECNRTSELIDNLLDFTLPSLLFNENVPVEKFGIDTGNHAPISQPSYEMIPRHTQVLKMGSRYWTMWERIGYLYCLSPEEGWNICLCVDYLRVNEIMIHDNLNLFSKTFQDHIQSEQIGFR